MVDRQPFPIPSELTPDTFCLCLQIPNNEDWKQVFNGILAQPTYWFNWARDDEHSGKILAAYWTEIYLNIDWTTMSCCCDNPPAIYRYNDDGVYQRSTDGGATWVGAPGYDYRNTSTIFPPPSALGIDNTKCQAADSAVKVINNEIVQAMDDTFAAAQILALIAAVLLAILSAGSLAALTPLITAIGAAILDAGVAATKAAFTDDVLNRLRCNIFCHMDSDSSIDSAGWSAVLVQLGTDETGIVYNVLYGIINAMGFVGLTNMIRSNAGDPDADCTGCGCTGDCDLANWTINVGTLISTTGMVQRISASLVSGMYYVSAQTPHISPYNVCCKMSAVTVSGAPTLPAGIILCGLDNADPGNITYPPLAPPCNFYIISGSAPFTVDITYAT